jgi:hypothetical protein
MFQILCKHLTSIMRYIYKYAHTYVYIYLNIFKVQTNVKIGTKYLQDMSFRKWRGNEWDGEV